MKSILTNKCIAVTLILMFQCLCGATVSPSGVPPAKVSAKTFQGFKRAPLPFPYQLVVFGRKVVLCDYEGSISVMDVTRVGYDSQYIYALDANGGVFILHLYDGYEEKYDSERSLPESILSHIRGGTVTMMDARGIVDAFLSSSYAPKDACFYQRNEIVKERYGRSPAESSFVPVDITMVVESVTNDAPMRIVRKFQNCTFSDVSIVCFRHDKISGMGTYWREINRKKGQFGSWTELGALACPISIQEGGEFEICIEFRAMDGLHLRGKKVPHSNCPIVTICGGDGGCSTMRVLFKADAAPSDNRDN